MDITELIFKVIPHLEKLFFPELLLGEKVSYSQDENGFWIRSNKDKSPGDIDYKPNIIINISPSENIKRVKKYFELSYFTTNQLEYIFNQLDKSLIKFDQIPLEKFVSYQNLDIKFELIEKDIRSKKKELTENYNEFKKSIINPSKKQNEIKIKNSEFAFKIKAFASKKSIASSLFERLEKEKYVDINSKNDFINAFIGNNPDNKINWTGMFGDLKSFINHAIEQKLIENARTKWVITSEIFTHEKIHFSSKKIKDTEITMNGNKIKKIVQSFL